MGSLKFQGYSVVFQEVPDEVSLVFNISGCPYKCRGCHSQNLWEYAGENLSDGFYRIFCQYENLVTCICFMGGDWNEDELIEYCDIAHACGLKTCLYTGAESVSGKLLSNLDYIKVGPYIEELGGLKSKTTNQRMYIVHHHPNGKMSLTDITYRFLPPKDIVLYEENQIGTNS